MDFELAEEHGGQGFGISAFILIFSLIVIGILWYVGLSNPGNVSSKFILDKCQMPYV